MGEPNDSGNNAGSVEEKTPTPTTENQREASKSSSQIAECAQAELPFPSKASADDADSVNYGKARKRPRAESSSPEEQIATTDVQTASNYNDKAKADRSSDNANLSSANGATKVAANSSRTDQDLTVSHATEPGNQKPGKVTEREGYKKYSDGLITDDSEPPLPMQTAAPDRPFMTFPERLQAFLDDPDIKGDYEDCFQWNPSGSAFCIHPSQFSEKILQKHFQGTKFESFTRKLNRWGFKRIVDDTFPHGSVIYQHELFQRGKPELLKSMSGGTRRVPAEASPVALPTVHGAQNVVSATLEQQLQLLLARQQQHQQVSTIASQLGAGAGGLAQRLQAPAGLGGLQGLSSVDVQNQLAILQQQQQLVSGLSPLRNLSTGVAPASSTNEQQLRLMQQLQLQQQQQDQQSLLQRLQQQDSTGATAASTNQLQLLAIAEALRQQCSPATASSLLTSNTDRDALYQLQLLHQARPHVGSGGLGGSSHQSIESSSETAIAELLRSGHQLHHQQQDTTTALASLQQHYSRMRAMSQESTGATTIAAGDLPPELQQLLQQQQQQQRASVPLSLSQQASSLQQELLLASLQQQGVSFSAAADGGPLSNNSTGLFLQQQQQQQQQNPSIRELFLHQMNGQQHQQQQKQQSQSLPNSTDSPARLQRPS